MEESRAWSLEKGAFHQEVDEWSWDGLEYAYGFGFWSYLYNRHGFQKECKEALIYRRFVANFKYHKEKLANVIKRNEATREKLKKEKQ